MMNRFLFCLGMYLTTLIGIVPVSRTEEPDWEIIKHSTLSTKHYADGDSFHVYFEGNKRRHYILRLYNVDTPESDTRYPDRLQQQGDYFGCTAKQALALGKQATDETMKWLSQPFTVYTLREKADGTSDKPRYYGLIQCADGEFLSHKLVAQGLARIYGKRVSPPSKEASYKFFQQLAALEKEAQKNRRGGWSTPLIAAGNEVPGPGAARIYQTTTVSLIYSTRPPNRPVGRLPPGHRFEWISTEPAPYYRVRFSWGDEKIIEGLMQASTFQKAKKNISAEP